MSNDLTHRTVRGISWNALAKIVVEVIGFVSTALLARLLSPADFGLLGMVAVFAGIVGVMEGLGLGAAIIQGRDLNENQLSSLFWVNLLLAIGLLLVSVVAAPLIARFYSEPQLLPIVALLGLTYPLSALAMVQRSISSKEMKFRQIGGIQIVSAAFGSIAGIIAAILGLGVWSLVLRRLASVAASSLLFVVAVRWRPKGTLRLSGIRAQVSFGTSLQAGSLVNYVSRNFDDLLIGRVIGPEVLGVYQMAYRMMLWPLQRISDVVGQVMFPALASVGQDRSRVRQAYLSSVGYIGLVTFPIVFGAWVVAEPLVLTLLGNNWAAVVPIFRVLCPLGATQSIATTTGWIFLSQGRTDVRLRLTIVFSILFVLSFLVGIRWGAIGVAICYSATSLSLLPIQLHVAGRLVDIRLLDFAGALFPVMSTTLTMTVLVWLSSQLIPNQWSNLATLTLQVVVGLASYLALNELLRIRPYKELRQLASMQIVPNLRASVNKHL